MYKVEHDQTLRYHSFTFRKDNRSKRGWLYRIDNYGASFSSTGASQETEVVTREWHSGNDSSPDEVKLYGVIEAKHKTGWMRRPDEHAQAEWFMELANPNRKGSNSWLAYGAKRFYHKSFFVLHELVPDKYLLYGVFPSIAEVKKHLPDAKTVVLDACVKYPKYFVSEFNTYKELVELWHIDK